MPQKEAPKPETWAQEDLKTLELEIDKGIDSLFVPVIRRAEGDPVAAANAGQDPHPQKGEPSESPGAPLNLDAVQIEIDREIDKLFVPSRHSDLFSGLSTSSEPGAPSTGLPGLIEQFNAAYLSLDWDFSRENLKKFIDALQRLEPMASHSPDAKSVFKIMEVILKRLLNRPNAVNTKLVQLIRDSQGLLAHMLLIEGKSGPSEKQRLKELVEKFQDLRQKALAAKAGSASPDLSGAPPTGTPSASTGILSQPDISLSALSTTVPDRSDDKTPLRAQKEDTAQAVASSPEPGEKSDPVLRGIRHADACLLVTDGKCFALPASCVLKAARSTRRIGRRVFKRGYATLSDFKPLFRGVKSGVLGQWAELHPKELRSYKFEPLGFDLAGHADATGPIAVLAADDQTHRIIFCDALSFISDAEIADESPAEESLFFKIVSRVEVPLFDLRSLRSSPPGSATIQQKD